MSGYRNQGFMDGLMRGYGFVDELRRKDEEAAFRKERAGKEDERWEKNYGLSLKADGRAETEHKYLADSRLPAEQARGLAEAGAKDAQEGYTFNSQQRPLALQGLEYQRDTRQPVEEVRETQQLGLQGARLGIDKTNAEIGALNRKGTQTSGMSLSIGPDGTISYSNDGGLAKPTINDLEKTIVQSQAGLDRLRGIQRSFDPKYLKLQSQVGAGIAGLKDKVGLSTPADKKVLEQYEGFKSKTLNNLNLYIKEITGAAMSEAEAQRIQSTMPSLGDGPTAFKAKMDSVMNELSRAQARAYYTRRNGVDLGSIPLASMDAIIDDYGEKVEQQIRQQNPGIDPKEAERVAHEQVKRAFGM